MKKLFTFIFAAALAVSCWGGHVTIGSASGTTTASPLVAGNKYSVCQQKYTKSELNNAGLSTSEGINAIAFYYAANAAGGTQNVEIYLTLDNNYDNFGNYLDPVSTQQKVFDGTITLPSTPDWYKINLDKTSVVWNGTSKSLMVTIVNKSTSAISGASHYCYTGSGRQVHKESTWSKIDAPTTTSVSATKTNNVPQIRFYFGSDSPTPTYYAPTNVSVTAKTSSSATIGWTKKDSANIKLEYKLKSAQSWTTAVSSLNASSYTITGLSPETEYDYQVFAVYPTGTSDAVAGSFTTDAASSHEHDGVSFQEWTAIDALPTSAGSYYLKDNVTVSSWTVPSGDTKICLNGNTITFASGYITIGNGKSLSIYNCKEIGAISAAQSFYPTIKINSGNLSLFGGSINNTGSGTDAFAVKVESGTFNIKGNIKMSTSGSAANIYLQNSSVITLAGAISNTTKLSVKKAANKNITSGWSTQMGSADPADFFISANSDAPAVVLVSGEAQLCVLSVTINEEGENTFTAGLKDVNLVRTFQANILNTISLPFALTDAQMKDKFGDDYELYELGSSSLTDGVLSLMFNKVTALDDGYPYLLRVSSAVVNPSFSSVTLTKENHTKQTTAVNMVAVISEDNITDYEKVLFLNAAGELNWSTAAGNFKGMRAYFKLNSGSPSAVSARHITLGTNNTTNLEDVAAESQVVKKIEDGKFIILKNGVKYNIQGQIVK